MPNQTICLQSHKIEISETLNQTTTHPHTISKPVVLHPKPPILHIISYICKDRILKIMNPNPFTWNVFKQINNAKIGLSIQFPSTSIIWEGQYLTWPPNLHILDTQTKKLTHTSDLGHHSKIWCGYTTLFHPLSTERVNMWPYPITWKQFQSTQLSKIWPPSTTLYHILGTERLYMWPDPLLGNMQLSKIWPPNTILYHPLGTDSLTCIY